MITPGSRRHRRGTVLVLVLGLIALFMALLLTATIGVFNTSKALSTLQKNVQSFVMLHAAKLYIDRPGTLPCTIGDKFSATSFPYHPQAHRLGWARITTDGTAWWVIAAGGATGGKSASGKANLNDAPGTADEQALANAMEIRYYYKIESNGSANSYFVALQPIAFPYTW